MLRSWQLRSTANEFGQGDNTATRLKKDDKCGDNIATRLKKDDKSGEKLNWYTI